MNHIFDGLRFYPGNEELINEFRKYEYNKITKCNVIDGEYIVIEIDGKKLLKFTGD